MECGQCKWWHRHEPRGDVWGDEVITMGECHGGPPTARTEASRLNPEGMGGGHWTVHYYQSYFPTTSEDDFCGKFCQKEDV